MMTQGCWLSTSPQGSQARVSARSANSTDVLKVEELAVNGFEYDDPGRGIQCIKEPNRPRNCAIFSSLKVKM
jgi:hypothetical protein